MTERQVMPGSKSILVLGVGNLLMGDDGVGIHVVRELERMSWPPNVRVEDGGMGGVTLISLWEETDYVVLIDAADMGKRAGACAVFSPEQVRSVKKDHRLSLHHADVLGLLDLMKSVSLKVPTVRIIGVQPERIEWRDQLSETVQCKIPEIVSLVKEEIRRIQVE